MNIQEIKSELGVETLSMVVSKTTEGEIYKDKKGGQWVGNFDNGLRRSISMPAELFDKVKANPTGVVTLYLEAPEEREGPKGAYSSQRILSQNEENIYGTL